MVYVKGANRIIELQGPGNCFEEAAAVTFTVPGTIEFRTLQSTLRLRKHRILLPTWPWFNSHVTQTVEDGEKRKTRVTLIIRHALLGPIFGYEGTFTATRRPVNRDMVPETIPPTERGNGFQ